MMTVTLLTLTANYW